MPAQVQKDTKTRPQPLEVARTLYGGAFSATRPDQLDAAMDTWSELPEADRSFTLGHLLFLNLRIQTENNRLFRRLLQEFETLTDTVEEVADEYLKDELEEDEGDDDDGETNEGDNDQDVFDDEQDAPNFEQEPTEPISDDEIARAVDTTFQAKGSGPTESPEKSSNPLNQKEEGGDNALTH